MPVSQHALVVNVKKTAEGWLLGLPNEGWGPHPDPILHACHTTMFDALSSLRLYLQVSAAANPLRVVTQLLDHFMCLVLPAETRARGWT